MWLTASLLLAFLVVTEPLATAQVVSEIDRQQALRHYRWGQDYLYGEEFDLAEYEFLKAVKLDPLLTLAHYGLGQAYMGMQRYTSAVRAYVACRDAYRRIASMQMSQENEIERRRDQEVREIREALNRLKSGQVKTSNQTMVIMQLESRLNELERMRLRRTFENYDTPAEVSLALGSAYFRSGSLEDAEKEYLAALAARPRFGEAHNNLAVVYMFTGRFREAEDQIKKAERAGFRVNPQFKQDLKAAADEAR